MEDGSEVARSKPRYLDQSFSAKLVTYVNEDQDRIRNAFNPCSYTTIQSLPSDPALRGGKADPDGIGHAGAPPFRTGRAAPVFTEFTYQSDPYSLVDELRSMQRKQDILRQQEIAGDVPFIAGATQPRAKYEDSYKYISEPYEAAKDDRARQKWLTENKILGAPFLPSGTTKALEKPTRALLTDIMTKLYRELCEDWEETQPTVFTTEEDFIVVYFSLAQTRNIPGIQAYMNVVESHSELFAKYELQKVREGWGIRTEDNHLMFTFRPPWVRTKALPENTSHTPSPASAS
jgi:hypothetical protein